MNQVHFKIRRKISYAPIWASRLDLATLPCTCSNNFSRDLYRISPGQVLAGTVMQGTRVYTHSCTQVARGILIIQLYYCRSSIRIHVYQVSGYLLGTKFSVLEYKLQLQNTNLNLVRVPTKFSRQQPKSVYPGVHFSTAGIQWAVRARTGELMIQLSHKISNRSTAVCVSQHARSEAVTGPGRSYNYQILVYYTLIIITLERTERVLLHRACMVRIDRGYYF